jgi:hypothetical protein
MIFLLLRFFNKKNTIKHVMASHHTNDNVPENTDVATSSDITAVSDNKDVVSVTDKQVDSSAASSSSKTIALNKDMIALVIEIIIKNFQDNANNYPSLDLEDMLRFKEWLLKSDDHNDVDMKTFLVINQLLRNWETEEIKSMVEWAEYDSKKAMINMLVKKQKEDDDFKVEAIDKTIECLQTDNLDMIPEVNEKLIELSENIGKSGDVMKCIELSNVMTFLVSNVTYDFKSDDEYDPILEEYLEHALEEEEEDEVKLDPEDFNNTDSDEDDSDEDDSDEDDSDDYENENLVIESVAPPIMSFT